MFSIKKVNFTVLFSALAQCFLQLMVQWFNPAPPPPLLQFTLRASPSLLPTCLATSSPSCGWTAQEGKLCSVSPVSPQTQCSAVCCGSTLTWTLCLTVSSPQPGGVQSERLLHLRGPNQSPESAPLLRLQRRVRHRLELPGCAGDRVLPHAATVPVKKIS